jgi:hypothetical protein
MSYSVRLKPSSRANSYFRGHPRCLSLDPQQLEHRDRVQDGAGDLGRHFDGPVARLYAPLNLHLYEV